MMATAICPSGDINIHYTDNRQKIQTNIAHMTRSRTVIAIMLGKPLKENAMSTANSYAMSALIPIPKNAPPTRKAMAELEVNQW